MAWTEESIVAEFRTHIAYWQEKLRLRDLTITVELADTLKGNRWVDVGRRNGGENRSHVLVRVRRGWYAEVTSYDVWHTSAHAPPDAVPDDAVADPATVAAVATVTD